MFFALVSNFGHYLIYKSTVNYDRLSWNNLNTSNIILLCIYFLEDALSLEARLCDYNGKFYCPLHHWNYTAIIPARVICNWEFEKKRVSQASFQLLNYKYKSKIYDLEKNNPKLFMYLDSLSQIKVKSLLE